jgi:hypothetical protein
MDEYFDNFFEDAQEVLEDYDDDIDMDWFKCPQFMIKSVRKHLKFLLKLK